jgi:hypothetical protein
VIEELRLFREQKLVAAPNDHEKAEVLRLGNDFAPSSFIAHRLATGTNVKSKLDASRPNINQWYARWRSIDGKNSHFPSLEEMFSPHPLT